MAEPREKVVTSEDVVVSKVGRELYEKFFRNYTRKQWDLDPSELDSSVTSRVPVRLNRDDRYFTDTYQAMPLSGYTRMFENMLDHPNIKIMLNADYEEVRGCVPYREMIFTGPIDEWLDRQPKGTRMVLWAHNGHVCKLKTFWGKSMGASLAEVYGKDQVVIGFAAGEGQYTAILSNQGLRSDNVLQAPAEGDADGGNPFRELVCHVAGQVVRRELGRPLISNLNPSSRSRFSIGWMNLPM